MNEYLKSMYSRLPSVVVLYNMLSVVGVNIMIGVIHYINIYCNEIFFNVILDGRGYLEVCNHYTVRDYRI